MEEKMKNQLVLGIYVTSWIENISNILKYTTLFASEFKLLQGYIILILFRTIIQSLIFNNHQSPFGPFEKSQFRRVMWKFTETFFKKLSVSK